MCLIYKSVTLLGSTNIRTCTFEVAKFYKSIELCMYMYHISYTVGQYVPRTTCTHMFIKYYINLLYFIRNIIYCTIYHRYLLHKLYACTFYNFLSQVAYIYVLTVVIFVVVSSSYHSFIEPGIVRL